MIVCVQIFMLFQTCMSFFLPLSSKEDISKNADNQSVAGSQVP